jgi:hypothetical protein
LEEALNLSSDRILNDDDAVVQYNKFIKGVDSADQYLSYYLVLKETVSDWKRWYYTCYTVCSSTHFFVYRTLNTN